MYQSKITQNKTMKKLYFSFLAIIALMCASFSADAIGWPANYQGVMLQGFSWDSYKTAHRSKWTDLTSQSDELSKYFSLIWVPNSAKGNGEGGGGNGYMPIYWFSNHNCAYGTEAELKTMISTFKAKGVGLIEDVVVNHRVGSSNWYNFPAETWNGKTYQLTNGAICSTDEMWRQGGQGCPYARGNADTGEDFDGARDLDHTNATVQDNVKNYCKFLLDDMGYVGFRLDMVKGYGGQYTKIYNQYANPKFCVGEYFDGNYDKVAAWIEATGRESAAFDFPGKYAINEAFASNDMRKLTWTNPDGKPQPAGLVHYGYTQLAVTFIDNHDTYRDGSKFPSDANILAANAFILCSPGTPCVFWEHYQNNKTAIQALVNARNSVGIHNLSSVNVVKLENNCYAAEVTGSKGKLVVKIGSDMSFSPGSGYTMAASGNNYCVWTTNSGGVTPTPTPTPSGDPFTVYFDNSSSKWTTPHIHYWGSTESTWPGVAMTKVSGDVWSYTVPAGTTGCLFNAGDGDATKTADFVAQANHIYTTSGDQGVYSGAGGGGGNTNPGTDFNIYFDNTNSNWTTPHIHHWGSTETTWPGTAMSKVTGNVWVYKVPAGTTGCLFNAGDGDATKTPDFVAQPNHIYTTSGDQGVYSGATDPTPTPTPGTYPSVVYMMGNVDGAGWAANAGTPANGKDGRYVFDVTIDDAGGGYGYFAFASVLGTTADDWDDGVNTGDRYGAPAKDTPIAHGETSTVTLYAAGINASASESWMILPGEYKFILDLAKMTVQVTTFGGDDPTFPTPTPGTYPAVVYIMGNVDGAGWAANAGTPANGDNGVYVYSVTIDDAGAGSGYFAFATVLGSTADDWDDGVNTGDRYGAPAKDTPISVGESLTVALYAAGINASASESWMLNAGKYDIRLNLANMTVEVGKLGSLAVEGVTDNSQAPVEFFNLQGVRVLEPSNGIFIRRQGNSVSKVYVK